jgi:Cu(I)/Ag(I) efflux system periplasmic protein CusF
MIGWFARGAVLAALASSLAPGQAAISPDAGLSAGLAPNLWRAQAENAATGVFHGVGVVTAIDATSGALTLDHDEIKGLMAAMEMMYRVKSRDISDGLGVGDRIAFDVDGTYTIVGVKRLSPGDGANK